jgi:hypothetical protein
MLSFVNWLHEEALKKKRKKNGEQHGNQGSGKVGDDYHQGQVDRANQEVQSNIIHVFPEP